MVRNAVENQVITLLPLGEIPLGIINDVICADGPYHAQIPGAAYAGDIRAERLGDLYRERTHASRRPVDQNLLSRRNLSVFAQAASPKPLQCSQSCDRRRSGLLKRRVLRLPGKF